MRGFVSNLTAAMLIVHALVGCCRHHHHLAACGEEVEVCDTFSVDSCQCCHHDHAAKGQDGEDHRDDGPAKPCGCKVECRSLCISLPPERNQVNAGQMLPSFDFMAVAPATAILVTHSADSCWGITRTPEAT